MHKFRRESEYESSDPEDDYFEKVMESRDLLLRLPDDEPPADPLVTIDRGYWEIRSLHVPETTADSYAALARSILNVIAHSIRRTDFQKLLEFTPGLYKKVPGYISILMFAYVLEFYSNRDTLRELLESVHIPDEDVPHFTHLLDELIATGYSPYADFSLPPMLELMGLEARLSHWVHTDFSETYRPLPILNPGKHWVHRTPESDRVMDRLRNAVKRARNESPEINMVGEGDADEMKQEETLEGIISMLKGDSSKDGTIPPKGYIELFMMTHAFDLMNTKKYPDFIRYVTNSFGVCPDPAFMNLRAAGWLMLGEPDLAKRDQRWVSEAEARAQYMFDSKV